MGRNSDEIWSGLKDLYDTLNNMLMEKPVELYKIHEMCNKNKIKDADLNTVRKSLHVRTIHIKGISYWSL